MGIVAKIQTNSGVKNRFLLTKMLMLFFSLSRTYFTVLSE